MKKADLIKFISFGSSADEQRDVLRWLEASDDNRKFFESLKAIWVLSALPEERAEESEYLKFQSRYKLRAKKLSYKKFYRSTIAVAASLLLFFFLAPYLTDRGFINKDTLHLANTSDEIMYYNLPDATRVTLYPGSDLYYNPNFRNKREVLLKGKGYFEVVADRNNPFCVHTISADVTVTGTKFLVDIPNSEIKDLLHVFLEEGKVCVKPSNGESEIAMDPGDLLTILDDFSIVKVSQQLQSHDMNLLSNHLHFENEAMKTILEKLENYHNVSFVCHSDEIERMLFTGDLKNESLNSTLELFKHTMDIQSTVKDGVVNMY